MMYDNVIEIKQLNEAKIYHELQELRTFQNCLKTSDDHTTKMTNLLNAFENRLTTLNDIIYPVQASTDGLQTKFTNLNKTISSINSIIEHYETSKNLSQIIKAGPGKDINTYIGQLDKLKESMVYFANNNKSDKNEEKIHIVKIEELWNIGKENVAREYELLLNKHTTMLISNLNSNTSDNMSDTQSISDTISVDMPDEYAYQNNSINEIDLRQITSIITWFLKVEPAYFDKLAKKLIDTWKDAILESLKKELEINNSMTKRQSIVYNMANVSPTLSRSGKMDSFSKKLSDLKKKTKNPSTIDLSVRGIVEQDFELGKCEAYIRCMVKCLSLFQIQSKFVRKLLANNKKLVLRVLDNIYEPVLRYMNVQTEKICLNVRQVVSKRTSKTVIAMFEVLNELCHLKPNFLKLFNETENYTSVHFLLEIFVVIEKTCIDSLKEVVNEIRNDEKPVSQNGNIHSITTETITFIENLLPYDVIAGVIANVIVAEKQVELSPSEMEISQRSSEPNKSDFKNVAYQLSSGPELKKARASLVLYFSNLFRFLNLNLTNKVDNFEDPFLKYIFLLNNYYKVLKLFTQNEAAQLFTINGGKAERHNTSMNNNNNNNNNSSSDYSNKSTLIGLYNLVDQSNYKDVYEVDINKFKREYSKCWSKLMSYLDDSAISNIQDGKMRDKERQLLKEKFAGFNKEFDEISQTQVRYYIPSPELAEQLREDNIAYIVNAYKRFFDKYSRFNFSSKIDKYIKYKPEDLIARMKEYFTTP